jgi:hypothetical protein
MKEITLILIIAVFVLAPAMAVAVDETDFEAKTTQNIINLCTASSEDPLFAQAVNFCHGYLVGAYHYHVAQASGPDGERMVCMPEPPPSRNEAIAMFIEWAKAHPEYRNEPPVETEFRFLIETWPCNP